MRTQTIAVVAGVYHDRVFRQAASLQTTKNRTNAFVHECNQTEVTLINTSVFVRRDPKEQLLRQTFSIQHGFSLLPFAHQTVSQRNVFAFWKRRCRIELHVIERIHIVERTVVGRMRLHECNHQNERIALMFLDEVAGVLL